jgi:hypothetical protein
MLPYRSVHGTHHSDLMFEARRTLHIARPSHTHIANAVNNANNVNNGNDKFDDR